MSTREAFVASVDARFRRSRGLLTPNWLRGALWPVVLAAGVGVLSMTVAGDGLEAVDTTRMLAVLVGLAFAASGLYAWGRRPENRLGPLMTVVGCIYLTWQILVQADASLLFTAGIWISDAWIVLFVLFLLAFPDGRLTANLDYAIVAMYATVAFPLELVWLLSFDTGGSPQNALLVWSNADLAGSVDWVQRTLIVTASVALAVTLSMRWALASPPGRRTLAPVLVGAAAILLGSVLVVLDKFEIEYAPARWLVHLAFIAIPLVILTGILRSRLARSSVGELLVELRGDPSPAELRDALSRALRDPSLVLAYWLPPFGSWADFEGRAIDLPIADSGRATTLIDLEGAHVAAIVHDPALSDEHELLDAVTAAAAIAIENGRLHVELSARLEEVKGSRARVIEAGQKERQRLERNLHDGAQQRLIALSLELHLLEERLAGDDDATARLGAARREISASLEELRAVAAGLHPAVVSAHGLEVALEQLSVQATVPVHLAVNVEPRLPEPLEVAAYYLVAESLANVGKHACASFASVDVTRTARGMVVEVIDDGVGGADTEGGSGLRGLGDRVETLGGRLRVWSPAGAGTRVRAEIPCAP